MRFIFEFDRSNGSIATCQRSSAMACACGICIKVDNKCFGSYCSPHDKTRDKSLPVPNGHIQTGGLFNGG